MNKQNKNTQRSRKTWIKVFDSSDCQIGLGLRPRPIWKSLEFFSSNHYFQIGQHVVPLHIVMKDLYVYFIINTILVRSDNDKVGFFDVKR